MKKKDYMDTGEWGKSFDFVNDFNFIAKPLSPKEANIKKYALHKNGFWYGCDRERLHIAMDDEMPIMDDGLYEITLKTKGRVIFKKAEDCKFRYPDIDVVWPAHKDYKEVSGHGLTDLYSKVIRAMEDNTLQVDFVKDIAESSDCWTAYIYDKHPGVAFEDSNKMALVMPVRM